MRIGLLTFVTNALSLLVFLLWAPSLVVLPLLFLLPCSAVLCAVDLATYRHERRSVAGLTTPLRRSVVLTALSLSGVLCVLVVLSITLYHGAQLGNLDPGGL